MNTMTLEFEGRRITIAEFWAIFHQRRAEREAVANDVVRLERDIATSTSAGPSGVRG
jgi:hypothetical protein